MDELLTLAHRLADAARPIARRYFRSDTLEVINKAAQDPITLADREIEETWRAILHKERPQDGIWGEEYGRENNDAEFVWILDPIDGTKAFSVGRATFGTMIGLYHQERGFVMGVVDQPVVDLRWAAAQHHGATLNGKSLHTKQPRDLKTVRLSLNNPLRLTPDLTALQQNLSKDIAFTSFSGDCMNYTGIADGSIHLCFDSAQKIYDIAAAIPIIVEAGGVITHKDGSPIGFSEDHTIMTACTPALHAEMLHRLKNLS